MKEGFKRKEIIYCAILFVLAALIRGIPEILGGTWPIGYDTLNTYMPDLLKFDGNFLRWLFSANLLYFILYPFYKIFSLDVGTVIKIAGPVLYGGLIVSLYVFLRKYMKWGVLLVISACAILIFEIASLRLSWDLYRNMLGLIFLFPTLYFLHTNEKLKSLILVGAFSLLIVLSNQLVAALWFVVLVVWLLKGLSEREYTKMLSVFLISVPAIIMFILIINTPSANNFGGHVFYENDSTRILNYFDIYKNKIEYTNLAGIIFGLFWLCYQFILPFAVIGFWMLRKNLILTTVSVFLLIGTFSSLIFGGYGLFVWDRWMIMLVFPLTIYAMWAIASVGSYLKKKFFKRRAALSFVLGLMFLACYLGLFMWRAYPYLTAEYDDSKPPFLNKNYNSYFPPTMVHNAVGYEHIKHVYACIDYLNRKAPESSVILVDNRFRGMVLKDFDLSERYVYSYPWSKDINQQAIDELREKNIGPIFTIWSSQEDIKGFKRVFYSYLVAVYRDRETYKPYQ